MLSSSANMSVQQHTLDEKTWENLREARTKWLVKKLEERECTHFQVDYEPEKKSYLISYKDAITGRLKLHEFYAETKNIALRKISSEFTKQNTTLYKAAVALYGADRVSKEDVNLTSPHKILIVAKHNDLQVKLQTLTGKIVKGHFLYLNQVPSPDYYGNVEKVHRVLKQYREKMDAVSYSYKSNFDTLVFPNSVTVKPIKDFSKCKVFYEDPTTGNKIKQKVTAEALVATIEKMDREYKRALKFSFDCDRYNLLPKIYEATSQPNERLTYLPGGDPSELKALFEGCAFNEDEIEADGEDIFYSKQNIIKHIELLVDRIATNKSYLGAPDDPGKRREFYNQISIYLSHMIVKLKERDLDPILRRSTILNLCKGICFCGGRWAGEIYQHYNVLHRKTEQSTEDLVIKGLETLRSGIIAKLLQSDEIDEEPSVHDYMYALRLLNMNNIRIPGSRLIDFDDPYGDIEGTNFQTDEDLLESFKLAYNVQEIASAICDQLNDSIREKPAKILPLLLETFQEIAKKKLTTKEVRRIELNYFEQKRLIENEYGILKRLSVDASDLFETRKTKIRLSQGPEGEMRAKELFREGYRIKRKRERQDFLADGLERMKQELISEEASKKQSRLYYTLNELLVKHDYFEGDEYGLPRKVTTLGVLALLEHLEFLEQG